MSTFNLNENANIKTVVLKGTALPYPKLCRTCLVIHDCVPGEAVICALGWLWIQCSCGSTLTIVPNDKKFNA